MEIEAMSSIARGIRSFHHSVGARHLKGGLKRDTPVKRRSVIADKNLNFEKEVVIWL